MAINSLGLKCFPIKKLKVGQRAIVGPYTTARTAMRKVLSLRKRNPEMNDWKFTQRQVLMVDPVTTETFKMYILTRTE